MLAGCLVERPLSLPVTFDSTLDSQHLTSVPSLSHAMCSVCAQHRGGAQGARADAVPAACLTPVFPPYAWSPRIW